MNTDHANGGSFDSATGLAATNSDALGILGSNTLSSLDSFTPLQPALVLGGTLRDRVGSDFDGDPFDLLDDAFIYAGQGAHFSQKPSLPLQRSETGDVLLGDDGGVTPLDDAIWLGAEANQFKVSDDFVATYGNWQPSYAEATPVPIIPSYDELLETEFAIDTTDAIAFDFQKTPLYNAQDWQAYLEGGTPDKPKVIFYSGDPHNKIPWGTNLEHTIIIRPLAD